MDKRHHEPSEENYYGLLADYDRLRGIVSEAREQLEETLTDKHATLDDARNTLARASELLGDALDTEDEDEPEG